MLDHINTVARPLKLSRRGFLAGSGTLALSVVLPVRPSRAQDQGAPTPPPVSAYIELREDGTALLRSPFVEGGQGIYTALAQIVGEELDLAPEHFTVETAPPGEAYLLMGGMRFTGGSFSVRSSYETMRRLGASARAMLIAAAAQEWGIASDKLTTEPGVVIDAAGDRRLSYGKLSHAAMAQEVPVEVSLRDPSTFRWIRTPAPRLDIRAKSTGQAKFSIDRQVDGMLLAAVRHAPRLGLTPSAVSNRSDIEAMRGVHSVHLLDGAVAVVAERFWQARKAIDAAEIDWQDGKTEWPLPADFSSASYRESLASGKGKSFEIETSGDVDAAFEAADTVIEAVYDAPYLVHGQLEPPSATARFNDDGTLDLWLPNQAPEMFQAAAATAAGIEPAQVNIHSEMLGGFFGRHFLYTSASPFPQAIALAKATGRSVKLIWSREEEFLRDAGRPLTAARFRAVAGEHGVAALSAEAIGEGPVGRWMGAPPAEEASAHEGISGKHYAIPNKRISHIYVPSPAMIGFWRSVGHSMNDYFYESFLDEIADAGGLDPFEMRMAMLEGNERQQTLLKAVADLSGGWKRGPFDAEDGSRRARGVAMASPFGSEVATIAEVSIDGDVKVHDIWVAIDPGSIVNPAIIEAQVQSAVALGCSQTLVEELVYEAGEPQARNFDAYPILTPDQMPRVHVKIIESGAPMGGIGEPGLPGVGPSVVNALAALTGQRIRSLPLSKHGMG